MADSTNKNIGISKTTSERNKFLTLRNTGFKSVEDIVAHMEDKSNAFLFNKKKLLFVEYDKERRVYKAYQADIIGWPRTG